MKRFITPIFAAALVVLAVCLWQLWQYSNPFDNPIYGDKHLKRR